MKPASWREIDRHASGLILLGLVLAAMLALTWRTWPDPIVDFGRELYVPWRIGAGQHLYSQIAYHNGPLSPHVNALWFSLFGVSLSALLGLNLLVVVGVVALWRSLLRDLVGPGGATVGGVTFLVLFAFGQFVATSNYNWMCPYSHEMTHGIALALLAVWLVRGFERAGGPWRAAAAGLVLGLVFLTKVEVFVAAACATAVGLGGALRVRREGGVVLAKNMACFLAGALLPVLGAFLLLARVLPLAEALHGTVGTWAYVFDSTLGEQKFVRHVSGLDDPGGNTLRLVAAAAWWLALLVPAAIAARFGRAAWSRQTGLLVMASYLGLAGLTGLAFPVQDWLRPLPVVLLVGFGAVLISARRAPTPGVMTGLSLLTLAGVLLLKVVLRTRVGHYGFGLAMPGTVLLFAALCGSVPGWLERRGLTPAVFQPALLSLWAGVLICHLLIIAAIAAGKTTQVGRGADRFFATARGQFTVEALRRLDLAPPSATLTAMIDCEMLNYLARRPNPVRYGNYNPQQVHLFGEDAMVQALEANPPDLIALVHSDTGEYGLRFFGADYGLRLRAWVDQHYEVEPPVIGAEPFRDQRFGVALLKRRR